MKKITKKNAIVAYKVFNSDFKCRGFQYKVGETYKHNSNVSLCGSGFHACIVAVDCFNYYGFNSKNKVAEVKLWGNIDKGDNDSDKICSSNIEIVKEIKWQEVLEIVNIGKSNTGYSNTGDCNTGYSNTGDRNTGYSNTGDRNTGDWNTGYRNTGYRNTGDRNTGYSNTGDRNTGDWNTGYRNTGYWNTGDRNTGYWNTGDRNTGYWNTGDRNTGDCNTGDWNTCDKETGYFNTIQSKKINIFNNPCDYDKWDKAIKPDCIYIELTKFILLEDMTSKEKEDNKNHETVGGYLKEYGYKEAWKNSWDNAKTRGDWEYEHGLLLALPNFDAKVFKEITGIDPIKEK